jgi:hypothetical protein
MISYGLVPSGAAADPREAITGDVVHAGSRVAQFSVIPFVAEALFPLEAGMRD